MASFESINAGFDKIFRPGALSLGIVVPIENYDQGPIPTMKDHQRRVQLIDELGFKALWIRDIPLNVPAFGDAGQLFDPFTYLGFLAGHTHSISLGVSSIALPLHHPLHVAKAAASVDQLSNGRMILGVASGDRPQEYPALNVEFENRDERFREAFHYLRKTHYSFPTFTSTHFGEINGQMDLLPKPTSSKIPLLMTGNSRQTLEWNAKHADGWMNYPRNLYQQKVTIETYRSLVSQHSSFDKPFMQPLYLDLHSNDDFRPQPIHLGFRIGINHLVEYLHQCEGIGVNHLAFNLRFNQLDIEETLEKLAKEVMPHFHQIQKTTLTA